MRSRRRENSVRHGLIAQLAARLLVEGAACDFESAKHKAAATMSLSERNELPDNLTILGAVIEYQRLFEHGKLHDRNAKLRKAALEAMRFLEKFSPRLHGAVLYGTCLRHSAVGLHLFADEVESVTRHLLQSRLVFRLGQTRPDRDGRHMDSAIQLEISRDGIDFVLTVLPMRCLRHPISSPLTNSAYQYMDQAQLSTLLAEDAGRLNLAELKLPNTGGLPL